MTFLIGTGPTELHAHIDLDHRITTAYDDGDDPDITVLDITSYDGHWAVLANVHPDAAEERHQ